jgi:hypothetical protein
VSLFCFVVVSSACVAGKIFKKSDLEAAAKHGTCSSCKADAPEGGFGVKQKRRGADGPMIPNAPTERIATWRLGRPMRARRTRVAGRCRHRDTRTHARPLC